MLILGHPVTYFKQNSTPSYVAGFFVCFFYYWSFILLCYTQVTLRTFDLLYHVRFVLNSSSYVKEILTVLIFNFYTIFNFWMEIEIRLSKYFHIDFKLSLCGVVSVIKEYLISSSTFYYLYQSKVCLFCNCTCA